MRASPQDFDSFMAIVQAFVEKNNIKFKTPNVLPDMISKGFIHGEDLELILGKTFFSQFRNHIKFDTNFIGKLKEKGQAITINDISFAIIKKGGKYDLEPYLTFNYN